MHENKQIRSNLIAKPLQPEGQNFVQYKRLKQGGTYRAEKERKH